MLMINMGMNKYINVNVYTRVPNGTPLSKKLWGPIKLHTFTVSSPDIYVTPTNFDNMHNTSTPMTYIIPLMFVLKMECNAKNPMSV